MPNRNPRNKPKNKLSRQMGENIWGKDNCPTNNRTYGPGQHGPKGVRRRSDYGVQLREKQKLKGYYGNIGESNSGTYTRRLTPKKEIPVKIFLFFLNRGLMQ